MRNLCWTIIITFLSIQTFAQQADMTGIWTGTLSLPNSLERTIVVNL